MVNITKTKNAVSLNETRDKKKIDKKEAIKIIERLGYTPITGYFRGFVSNAGEKDKIKIEETHQRSIEGWRFRGHSEKLVDILIFEGNYNLVNVESDRKIQRGSYCKYIYNFKTKEYKLSEDFCGIFFIETDRVTTGNYFHLLDAIYVKNLKSSVKIKFINTKIIGKRGEEESVTGYIIEGDKYNYLINSDKDRICNKIFVFRSTKEDAEKEFKKVKKALSALGLNNIDVKYDYDYLNEEEKTEDLKQFEKKVKDRYKKALSLLKQGNKIVFNGNTDKYSERIGNMEIYCYKNHWSNGEFGLTGTEVTRCLDFIIREISYKDERRFDGNIFIRRVLEDSKYHLMREKADIVSKYYKKLINYYKKIANNKNINITL